MVRSVIGSSILHCGPTELFLVPASVHDWCNKGHGMCYPVCGMMHIKEQLPPIGKNSPCDGSGFPLAVSKWSFTLCLTPYNRKFNQNVLNVSLNKHFLPLSPPTPISSIFRRLYNGKGSLVKYPTRPFQP